MKVGTILTATDLNPLYCDFIPIFIRAWKKLLPESDICIVLIANEIPSKFLEYSPYIRLFPPIPGIHTAFQAQCIRLLYPRQIQRNEGVLITDMDMLPMNRTYYVDTIAKTSNDTFVVYRDVCLPGEISMCYNIACPGIWQSMFGNEDITTLLQSWYKNTNYSGDHGGPGWGTDQVILVNTFNTWKGNKQIFNDRVTQFQRLDRSQHMSFFSNRIKLQMMIHSGFFTDYHCLRPYTEHREINDFIVSCL